MKLRIGTLAVLASLAVCAAAWAKPVIVNVRIEGPKRTFFDGNVAARPEVLTKDSSGPHACNGENNGANKTPGATVTTALDAAARKAHFSWAATWYSSPPDFLVTAIGPFAGGSSTFWSAVLNYKTLPVGGCQVEVHTGDQVLWYFASTQKYDLELIGPKHVGSGHALKLKVLAYSTSAPYASRPAASASVDGHKASTHGIVTLHITRRGRHKLRATMPDAVRSNAIVVDVRAAGT